MPRKNVKKVNLADLLDGKVGEANAEFYKDDPEKRANHVNNRVARARLMATTGGEYKRQLSGDAARDIQYHELAREFISNGFNQTKAYASVFGKTQKKSKVLAHNVFNSMWMRAMIHDMVRGVDGELADVEKEFLIEQLMKQIESNVLDYVTDDGDHLNVKELKSLPLFCQQIIKKLDVHTWHEPMMEVLHEGDDPVEVAQIRHQKVHIELYDKQKAMELLAKAMRWISSVDVEANIYLGAEQMIAANKRIDQLKREDPIEGEYETVTTD